MDDYPQEDFEAGREFSERLIANEIFDMGLLKTLTHIKKMIKKMDNHAVAGVEFSPYVQGCRSVLESFVTRHARQSAKPK